MRGSLRGVLSRVDRLTADMHGAADSYDEGRSVVARLLEGRRRAACGEVIPLDEETARARSRELRAMLTGRR